MKKKILGILIVLTLFVVASPAKAATMDDLMAQVKTLGQQVSSLSSQLSALALRVVAPATLNDPLAPTKDVAPVLAPAAFPTSTNVVNPATKTTLPSLPVISSTLTSEPKTVLNDVSTLKTITTDGASTSGKVLGLGTKNTEVKAYQFLLQNAGYLSKTATVDGSFGNLTKTAILKFQKEKGLTQTGDIDLLTKKTLKSLIDSQRKESNKVIMYSTYVITGTSNGGCNVWAPMPKDNNQYYIVGSGTATYSPTGAFIGCAVMEEQNLRLYTSTSA